MLLGRPTRVGLSQADVRDYQARYEARQSIHMRPGGLRLSSTPSHVTYASITRAHQNVGRARADSCSSKATICGNNNDTQVLASLPPHHSIDAQTLIGSIEDPLLDPGAPDFVPEVRFSLMTTSTESHVVGRYPPFVRPTLPKRTSSRRAYEHKLRQHTGARDRTSHRSSPNLLVPPTPSAAQGLRIRTRSSSLSWQGSHGNEQRAPRLHNDTVGFNSSPYSTIQPDRLSRDSPLDELSQQLSRMATTACRPRSVGRSFERAQGKQRVSLLSGNPFQIDGEPASLSEVISMDGYRTLLPPQSSTAPKVDGRRDSLMDPHHLYELSLALPSPHMQTSPVSSGLRSPISSTPSSPMPDSTPRAAQHVTVYDDSMSATLQPQTPADLARSTAPRHRHSPSVVRRINEELANSPGDSVPRRTRHRQNYPSDTPAQHVPRNGNLRDPVVGTPVRHSLLGEPRSSPPPRHHSSSHQQSSTPVYRQDRLSPRQQHATTLPHNDLRRSHRSNRSGNSENSVELALEMVEEDRRTRVIREGGVDLDITPPAEGRYERYFS
ncbi:hypothetical protein Slin15195_G065470 [Septoria linicola]|uniref:Uncharacterized protein n=1 Tax=Septoria linicola TaxID=215465 RepID=A0A9Q9AU38_9PEZI|nr:hypothetical protein Slin14017_G115810 [Septoria linicola]USW53228.1 hypothetical protein Slin15195_G065470 [Septoria linicola]